MKSMQKITTIISDGRTFHIVHDERGYWGIEDCFLDEKGCLKVQLNGLQGCLSDDLNTTIQSIRFRTHFDKLIASGMSFEDAALEMWAH